MTDLLSMAEAVLDGTLPVAGGHAPRAVLARRVPDAVSVEAGRPDYGYACYPATFARANKSAGIARPRRQVIAMGRSPL